MSAGSHWQPGETDTSTAPRVLSVNVSRPHPAEWHGRAVTTAIWKEPVTGPVALAGVNLDGDDQADRRVHGGPDKAVYAYATEDYDWWATTTGDLAPGTFGENLTTAGIDLGAGHVGDRWRVGSAVLEVSQPRQPCYKLAMRMGDEGFPDRFEAAGRPGAYLRIVQEGAITAGDLIVVEPAPQPAVTVVALATGALDEAGWRRVADDGRVPDGWRRTAERSLRR
jgi:MOSC domain-containing protein YiiM